MDVNKILIYKNPDKGFHEKWTKKRGKLNFPHPFRCSLMGPPNKGKTNVAKNLLVLQDPPFEKLVVVHTNPDYTQEYSDTIGIITGEIPPKEFWNGREKTLVILDDIDFKNLKGNEKTRLNRLYGNWSTHNNISIINCTQDCFELPPIIRRCSNLWVLWKPEDLDNLSRMARKVGMDSKKLTKLFTELATKNHDSIWIDRTKGTPYPLRLNGFEVIRKADK